MEWLPLAITFNTAKKVTPILKRVGKTSLKLHVKNIKRSPILYLFKVVHKFRQECL